ncbi:MAG: hypothetical protein AAF621_06865 [Pseudomonadota bacterium]
MDVTVNDINHIKPVDLPQKLQDKNAWKEEQIDKKSKEFEAVFIAESLKHAKIGMPKDSELQGTLVTDTFDSFMTRALADSIVEQGGFGLAEHIKKSLLPNNNAHSQNIK